MISPEASSAPLHGWDLIDPLSPGFEIGSLYHCWVIDLAAAAEGVRDAEILRMRRGRMTFEEIALELEVTRWTVARRLERMGDRKGD